MKKPQIVFLTGLMSNKKVFQYQVEELQDIADILIVELTDVATPAAMTDKVLKLTPDRFMLVGHSIGGWVALRVMKVAPARVQQLCIISTAAKNADVTEISLRKSVLTRVEQHEFQKLAVEVANKFTFNESAKKIVLDMFLQVGEQALINQTRAMMIREDLTDTLSTITCPTLVIHAEKDQRFTLATLEEMCKLIPNAILKIIPECGHMSPMEEPKKLTDLLHGWISGDL